MKVRLGGKQLRKSRGWNELFSRLIPHASYLLILSQSRNHANIQFHRHTWVSATYQSVGPVTMVFHGAASRDNWGKAEVLV